MNPDRQPMTILLADDDLDEGRLTRDTVAWAQRNGVRGERTWVRPMRTALPNRSHFAGLVGQARAVAADGEDD